MKKNFLKRGIGIVMSLMLVCSLIPATAMAKEVANESEEDTISDVAFGEEAEGTEEMSEEDIATFATTTLDSGSCGNNATWTLSSDGTLTISGSGETEYYASSNPPWYSYRKEIKKIVVSSGITSLGTDLFYNCTAVTSVSLPSSLTVINTMAFAYCSSLTSVIIPDSVTKVGSAAFSECHSLTSVTIGAKVEDLDTGAFTNCTSLSAFTLASGNNNFSTSDGVLFNKDKTELIIYPPGNASTSYTVPGSVKTIGENAFERNSYLTEVTIPSSVTTIERYAFFLCRALSTVNFNSGLKTIESYAFSGCSGLTNISLPDSVSFVDGTAFHDCPNLTITYPSSLTKMEDGSYKLLDSIKIKGTFNYDYAYQVLDLVNQERKANGRSELKMDKELLEAAMQRAAECRVYYSHTRPSGLSCSSISTKLMGENIAAGQSSPSNVMNSWMNSEMHKINILMGGYQSIGIGCFEQNGTLYWVQIFSYDEATTLSKPSNTSQTVTIEIDPDTVGALVLSSSASYLSGGSSITLSAKINNAGWGGQATIENSSLKWSSSDTSIATVNSYGEVTAVGNGSVKITAKTNNGLFSASVTIACTEGTVQKASDGNWYYYVNGVRDTSYTGFAENSNGKWYVENGMVTFKTTGVILDSIGGIGEKGAWYYVVNSQVQTGYTGVANHANASGWWYVKNGKVDFSANTVAQNNFGWWYVVGGKVIFTDTVAENQYGWWYITGGKVDFNYSGVGNHGNAYGWWYIKAGKVDFSANTVAQNSFGWWYVKNGKVDFSANTVAQNNYGWWYVTGGKVDFSANTVAENQNGWWYVEGGKVNFNYTGVSNYANAYGWWYIRNGKVDFSFSGTASNKNGTWTVVNGKVQF